MSALGGIVEDGTRIATTSGKGDARGNVCNRSERVVKQCAVLFVNPDGQESVHPQALRAMGFLVDEVSDWPDGNDIVRNYHVVIVYVRTMNVAPMLAARLRAKPHFGRRLLIALVAAETTPADRRAAEASGFDEVMNECCDSRHLTTRMLRGLRGRPELRCLLPPMRSGRAA
jgi:hypothetical protein